MKTIRNLLIFLTLGAAAAGAVAVAFVDPPAPTRLIEAPAALPETR